MIRASETADIILSEIGKREIKHDALLEEGPPCLPEPLSTSEINNLLFMTAVGVRLP